MLQIHLYPQQPRHSTKEQKKSSLSDLNTEHEQQLVIKLLSCLT